MQCIQHTKIPDMTNKIIKFIAFVFSSICLLGLFLVNISLVLGWPAPFEPTFVQIFFALFPLWAFTIFSLNKTSPPTENELKEMTYLQKIGYLIGNPPTWALTLLSVIYLYAFYSFFLFATEGIMDPVFINGQYQTNNHGTITVYTEAEYQVVHNLHLRAITGFFMAFFAVSTVALAPWPKQR